MNISPEPMRLSILATLLMSCATPTLPDTMAAAPPAVSAGEKQLRALAGRAARRGDLVVTPDTVQLRIRRGERSIPFLDLKRSTFDFGCWREPPEDRTEGVEQSTEDVWWLFNGDGGTVALQLTASDIGAWFWDDARDCAVRVPAMEGVAFDESTPDRYYQGDDAQIAYRWNQSRGGVGALTPREKVGNPSVDILADIPGEELLVVEPDVIAIRSSDGRMLLQEEFDVDPGWPCYNSQLTVFRNARGGTYAVVSFETFGTSQDCDAAGGDSRYTSAVLDWQPDRQLFVPAFRISDRLRPVAPGMEDSLVQVDRVREVVGGQLEIRRTSDVRNLLSPGENCVDLDRASGICLKSTKCWKWSTSDERQISFTLIDREGVRIDIGTARATTRARGEECGAQLP